ncbi:MAG: hypothetical protein V3G42_03075 [Oscillospiraceae bacterium]
MSYEIKQKQLSGIFAVVFAVLFMLYFSVGIPVSAAVEYYASWEEYVAAGEPNNSWQDKANAIDAVLEASYQMYTSGDQT